MTTSAHGPPPPTAPGDSEQRCSTEELLDAWMGIIRGFRHVNRILAGHVEQETGLPVPDFIVLAQLRRSSDPAVPLSTLARELFFSSGGFTKLADRLQQAGLIQREPSPCDRRVTNAVLTPAGRAAADRALAVYCAALRELVLRHLGTDGLRALVSQMSRLSDLPPSFLAEQPEPEATARPVLNDLLELPAEGPVPGPCRPGLSSEATGSAR
jgi:DNA-binding MarR family transcriptional regulator